MKRIHPELPKDSHSPFSMEKRLQILKGFLQYSIQGKITPFLLKSNRLNISPELYLSIYDETDVHFLWNLQNVSFSSCMIQESGIRKSLSDFLNYIRSTEEDTYSKEESLIMIKEFCRQYFKV